ncbi:MAG: 4Fe-4S dicluster domain-containing protein [Bacteriovoracaceae bacterium]
MDNKKEMSLEYWQDVENKDLENVDLKEEFPEATYTMGMANKNRRDFLKIMGFSLSVLPMVTSCKKISAQKAIPYLHKNDQITPGVANWYATTSGLCPTHCSLLVKTREGRPIKIEGNTLAPLSKGGICPSCQASVLSLYDSTRFKASKKDGQYSTYDIIDAEIKGKLKESASSGKKTALVMSSIYGPSLSRVVNDFQKAYENVDIILYNPMGNSAESQANLETFGHEDLLQYDLEKAEVIVGVSADFLSSGTYPVYLTKQYSKRKDLFLGKNIVRHIQVESYMTMTGSNADSRVVVSFDEESIFVNNLLARLQDLTGSYLLSVRKISFSKDDAVNKIAKELLAAKGKSVVICGTHKVADHIKVNAINDLLSNINRTVFLTGREFVKVESDVKFSQFVKDAQLGMYANVIFYDVNPYYDYFDQTAFENAMKNVNTKISLASAPDETAEHSNFVVPDRHYLEKWDDFEIACGVYSFSQPVIQSLFNNRPAQESLLVWSDKNINYDDYMRQFWGLEWNKAIHDGILIVSKAPAATTSFNFRGSSSLDVKTESSRLKLVAYEKIGLQKGKLANNPWLQEMPDPITKVTWDNYLMVSPKLAKSKSISTGEVVKFKVNGKEFRAPALVQPGVHENVVALAVGYGRTVSGKAGKNVGVNAWSMVTYSDNSFHSGLNVEGLEKTGEKYKLALTQTHHSMEGRDIVRETSLNEYVINPAAGNAGGVKLVSMWKDHKKDGHQWAMMIDLNKCTGCSGCVVSCNAENNVPVVGKDEVHNRREMHWIRLDRYYKGDDENPEVVHQPMMCVHCDNAPCETVCPVLATVHSSDGLNQQVYNRCVGTRYCANNCPYKVRRFNWFDYAHDDKLENMVLNPDIAVRTRGVMEKCSMCVHRIQEGKLQAKKDGRELKDGDIKLACQQSCPADAIVFGDINDPQSEIAKKLKDPRYYRVLEEVGVAPRVGYLTKVRNTSEG